MHITSRNSPGLLWCCHTCCHTMQYKTMQNSTGNFSFAFTLSLWCTLILLLSNKYLTTSLWLASLAKKMAVQLKPCVSEYYCMLPWWHSANDLHFQWCWRLPLLPRLEFLSPPGCLPWPQTWEGWNHPEWDMSWWQYKHEWWRWYVW